MNALWHRGGLSLGLIAACGLLVFHNTLGNSFHYDDEHSIVENPHIRSLGNIPRFFVDPGMFSGLPEARMYRPLLLVTYAANYAVGGYGVFGYHLVNLLLHLVNACLVWTLAARLLGKGPESLLAGLLFVAHPLTTESVNYISSRSELLGTMFFLLAFLLLVGIGERGGGWRRYGWLGICFLGALLAKSIAIVLPLIGAVYLLLTGRGRHWRALVIPLMLSGLYLVGTRAMVGKALLHPVRDWGAHLATQIKAGVFYIGKVAVPAGLSVEPQFRVAGGFGEGAVLLAGGGLVSLLLAGVIGRRRNRMLAFSGAWFLLALLPSSLVPLYVLVNEHRLYLPLAGAALGMGALLQESGPRVRQVWVLVLLCLAIQGALRNRVWESEESLWGDAVAKGPQMARPHINLGKAYLEQGRYQEAIQVSQQGLGIDPGLARAHYNIGTAYLNLRNYELAEAYYQRALERQPDLVQAHNNLGNVYQEQGRYARAVIAYHQALAIQEHPSFYHNLGNAFLEEGRMDSARFYFGQALRLDPEMREAHKGLAKACLGEDRLQSGLGVLEQALQRWPGDKAFLLLAGEAHAALGQEEQAVRAYQQAGLSDGQVWLELGDQARRRQDWERARRHYERALEQDQGNARIHEGLGQVFFVQGEVPRALEAFRRAAQLDPGFAEAFADIGRVYLKYGRTLEAIAALERAVQLNLESGEIRGLLADAYQRGGKREKAILAYQQAMALAPEKAELYHNLGFIYAQEKHWGEAERMYRAALEREPRLVEGLFNLGYLYLEQERYPEAAEAFQRVLELEPNREGALLNLASAWLGQGEEGKAREAYTAFLEIHRKDDDLRERTLAQLRLLRGQNRDGR